ncbi:MAG: cache domain-containing protein [Nitrospirota bacterium]
MKKKIVLQNPHRRQSGLEEPGEIIKIRLFLKRHINVIIMIFVIVIALLYLYPKALIEEEFFKFEKKAARTTLSNVYEIVQMFDRALVAHKESSLQAKKKELKNVVMMAESYINNMEENSGSTSDAKNKTKILETMSSFRFGNSDYIFILDNNSVMLSHPDKQLVGTNFLNKTDVTGNPLVPPAVVEAVSRDGEGYHTYKWKRFRSDNESMDNSNPLDKLTYFKYLPKQNWIIATGVYMDDMEKAESAMKNVAIENLRQILRGVKIAKTGYVFIFSAKTDNTPSILLVHPDKGMENTKMERYIEPVTKKSLYEELTAIADKQDNLRYKWDKPEDLKNYVYSKIAWVTYYKPLGWYIGASIYVDELRSSSHNLIYNMLRIISFALVALIVIAYRLYKPFLIVISKVKEHISVLQTKNHTLDAELKIKDAAEKKHAAELQAAYDKLKALDERKTVFLSNVSHEIRTPLTSVLGFAERIKEYFEETVLPHVKIKDEKVERAVDHIKENIDTIISEGERLTSLIVDVLDMAKMEAGKIDWKKENINVKSLLERAAEVTALPEQRKNDLNIVIENENNIPDTIGDFYRLLQVVLNLISNALKFSTDGDITLKAACSHSGKQLTISVSDHGIGIPKSKLNIVFEKFEQIGDVHSDRPTGAGLGLQICKEIVKHHGGRIWVESIEGKGSTFFFTLPVIRADHD